MPVCNKGAWTSCSFTPRRTSIILSGNQTPRYYRYQTLVVPLEKEPVFITRLLEESNVQHLSWVEESRPCGDKDHPDWEEYDQAMVRQDAVVVLAKPERVYGRIR